MQVAHLLWKLWLRIISILIQGVHGVIVLLSDTHVPFLCEFVRTVWMGTGIQHLIQESSNDKAFVVLYNACKARTRGQCVLIGMFCWSI